MNSPAPDDARSAATGPIAAFLLLALILVGGWWYTRSAASDALDEALAPWAGAALPEPGAPVDAELAAHGAEVFQAKCAACHALTAEDQVGPNLVGVTERRSPAWLQAMILAPDSMTREDPDARALKAHYGVQMMVPGGIDTLRTRAVLEFLRRVDGQEGR